MNKRRLAITTGVSLILMTVIAGFSIGYGLSQFYSAENLGSAKETILSQSGLYNSMLIGVLLILILDLLVSYTLYKYFEDDNRKVSAISGIIRVVYTIIFAAATYFLVINMNSSDLTNEVVVANYQQFQTIWNGGLMIFGIHVVLIGWLMKIHQRIPKVLWYLTLFAGLCYVAVHLLKLTADNVSLIANIEMVLALPMALGELGLAVWLLVKGGKATK